MLSSSLPRTLTMCALAASRAQRRRPALHAALARWLEGREGEGEGLAMAQLLMRGAEGAGGAADELRHDVVSTHLTPNTAFGPMASESACAHYGYATPSFASCARLREPPRILLHVRHHRAPL